VRCSMRLEVHFRPPLTLEPPENVPESLKGRANLRRSRWQDARTDPLDPFGPPLSELFLDSRPALLFDFHDPPFSAIRALGNEGACGHFAIEFRLFVSPNKKLTIQELNLKIGVLAPPPRVASHFLICARLDIVIVEKLDEFPHRWAESE
jgi:hypothetical protein